MPTGADMNVDIGSSGGGGPDLNALVSAIVAQSSIMTALTTSIGALATKMDSLTKSSGKGQKAQKASQTADPATAAQDEGHNRMSEMDSLRKLRRTTARHMVKVNDGRSVTIAALDKLTSYQERASRILKRAVEGGEIGKFGTIAESLQFEWDKLSKAFQKKRQVIQGVIKSQDEEKRNKGISKNKEDDKKKFDKDTVAYHEALAAHSKLFKRLKDGRPVTEALRDRFDRLLKVLNKASVKVGVSTRYLNPLAKNQAIDALAERQKEAEKNKDEAEKQEDADKKKEADKKKFGDDSLIYSAASIAHDKLFNRLKDGRTITEEMADKLDRLWNRMSKAGIKIGLSGSRSNTPSKDINSLMEKQKEARRNKVIDKEAEKISKKKTKDEETDNETARTKLLAEKNALYDQLSSLKKLTDAQNRLFKRIADGEKITYALIRRLEDFDRKIEETEDAIPAYNISKRTAIDKTARIVQLKKVQDDKELKDSDDKKKNRTEKSFTKEYDYWSDLNRKMQLLGGHFKLSAKSAVSLIMGLEEFENKGKTMGKAGYTTSSSPFKGLSDELNTKLEEAKGRASKGSSGEKPKETFLQSAAKQVNPATLGISVLQTALSSMTGAITGIAGALLGSPIVAVITAVLAPFQSLMAVVGKVITVLVNWIMIATGLMGFLKRLELSLDAFAARIQLINDVTLSLDTAVQRASSGIATSMANLGSGVVGAVDNVLSNPLTGLLDIVDKISKFVGLVNPGLMDRYNKVLENLMALIGSALQPVVSEITSLLYIFGTQLKPVIGMIGSQLAVAVRAFAMAILPVIPDLIRGLLALAQTLIGFVADVGIKLATEGPGTGALGKSPEQRIREEEQRLNEIDGITRDVNTPEQAPAGAAYNMTNRGLAESQIRKDIAKEQPAADFMDSAIAKNAKFSSGMDMGKSSVQKAFESSSAYGQDPSDQQTLDAAQAEFYKNPAAWVKKAMAGAENKPRQQVGGNAGGQAGGPNKMQAAMMLMQMGQVVGLAPAAALRDVGIIT